MLSCCIIKENSCGWIQLAINPKDYGIWALPGSADPKYRLHFILLYHAPKSLSIGHLTTMKPYNIWHHNYIRSQSGWNCAWLGDSQGTPWYQINQYSVNIKNLKCYKTSLQVLPNRYRNLLLLTTQQLVCCGVTCIGFRSPLIPIAGISWYQAAAKFLWTDKTRFTGCKISTSGWEAEGTILLKTHRKRLK